MSFELKQVITQILAFLIMLWILKRYAWKPLMDLMDKRTRLIQEGFEDVAKKKLQADEKLAEYQAKLDDIKEEGRVIIQDAVKEARKMAQDMHSESQKKAHEVIKRAQEEASRELAKAHGEFKTQVVDIVCQALAKLTGVTLSAEDREKLTIAHIEEV